MKVKNQNTVLRGRAIAGSHVVVLGWDFVGAQATRKAALMGFAIERSEFNHNNVVIERYYLKGIKRFFDKDKGLPPGTPVSTFEHPVQSFQWGDYTPRPGVKYEYTVLPLYGTPKHLTYDDNERLSLIVTTEPLVGKSEVTNTGTARHDIFFNRGVIGSQAYVREFQNATPDPLKPDSREMKWLSRGLYEALLSFISHARDGFALRAAFYEFRYQPVANAFAKAIQAGADVKIVYDAESSYKTENLQTIVNAGLEEYTIRRTVTEGIRHNKFIVLLTNSGTSWKPLAVFTGSTNISDGGIFGHSNVGHIIWDDRIAADYLAYWTRLSENMTPRKLRVPNTEATPLPTGKPPKNSVIAVFSPRDGDEEQVSLQWYADRMAEAKRIVCLTVAFNLDEVFQKVISQQNDVLRYIVKDDDLDSSEIIGTDRDVLFASGGYLGPNSLLNFLGERGNPLNSNDYIHNKFLLVDPLGSDPLVVTGSANFSRPSQRINDENMIVVRGNKRVADIYFGEFMRIFDHHYARYLNRKMSEQGTNDPKAGYLKDTPNGWVPSHFAKGSYKTKRRKYFVGG